MLEQELEYNNESIAQETTPMDKSLTGGAQQGDDLYAEDAFGIFNTWNSTDDEDQGQEDTDQEESGEEDDNSENSDDATHQNNVVQDACSDANNEFKKYCRNAQQHFGELTKVEMCCIKIMYKLYKKRAPLDAYETVMEWHLRESDKLLPHQSMRDSRHFISRQRLMKKLRKRYNLDQKYALPRDVLLPHTNTRVSVHVHQAMNNVMSIITDPRWKDDDWLFFNDDPFGKPPANLKYIADLNTGQSYLETHKRLITKPNQILVPIPLYIDGAVTGQYDKLQVEAMTMSIGILNRKARDKEAAWRTLGFVPNYAKEDSRGKRIFVESGHVSAFEMYADLSEDEGEHDGVEDDVDKAADYHAIIAVIMESLRALLEKGMEVDFFYKGKLYKKCKLVFFIPFVKCDGEEGDKLCLSFRSRGKGVKQLCRYCQCPNEETDNHEKSFPFKTEPLLKRLYDQGKQEQLRMMSQVCAQNAFHGLRFGLHNNRGIHGACPWELLHAVLLGIFKYCRDCFFLQLGKTSKATEEVNALAKEIGALLARQSERNKPRTKFAKGIFKGKLMAKEFSGVLLIMSAVLCSEAGAGLLQNAYKKNFRQDYQRKDWLLLVETLLQWEAYLKLDQMELKDVVRLKKNISS
ncbi:hypothetical protein HC928_16785 [bacterium]|nr:hypothetical protein [bacterium]